MDRTLADFRIENDSVVLLSFVNGESYRVNPSDLERYLSGSDAATVRRALKLRHQFITRILPPTAMVFLAAAIIGLGSHDLQRVQALLHPSIHSTQIKPVHTAPSSPSGEDQKTLPASASVATTPGVATGGNRSSGAGAASSATRQTGKTLRAAVPGTVTSHATPLTTSVTQPVSQAANPVTHTVKSVLAPVTTTVQPVVNHVVAPIAKTVTGLLP